MQAVSANKLYHASHDRLHVYIWRLMHARVLKAASFLFSRVATDLIAAGDVDSVTILSPYRGQVRLISEELRREMCFHQ